MVLGMEPVTRLLYMSRYLSELRFPISEGIVPVKRFVLQAIKRVMTK
jgi:hypothetical protein